jgi:hypothetical protein
MKNYTNVRLITDKYKNEGANKGDTGSIIEVYLNIKNPNQYLVELYDPKNGVTKTIIVVTEEDIEKVL